MSCSSCGSVLPNCGCVRQPVCTTCGTNGNCACNSGANCITNLIPASPQPFYSCAPTCQETNTQRIVVNQFAVALKVVNSWNVPACEGSSIVTIPGLVSITIGSYLWNEEFGYFEITAFDSGLQQVTLVNHCTTGNAAPGTNIPACTEFLNTAPPVDIPTTDICVAIDFTAPAVSDCIDITLTSTTGIGIGDTVEIGSGFYRVSAIKPNQIITICNDGSGITPGTPVIAGTPPNYNYCLQIIATSPCDATMVTQGVIIVCNDAGQTTTITGAGPGMVPVQIDGSSNVEFRQIVPPQFCTNLTAPLNIVNGTASYANFAVTASAGFVPGTTKVVIGGYTGIMSITAATDATHLSGTFSPVPSTTFSFPTGTLVCTAPCCTAIEDILGPTTSGAQCSFDMGQDSSVPADEDSGPGAGGSLTTDPATTATGPFADYVIENNSSCKNMVITINVHYLWKFEAVTADLASAKYALAQYTPLLGFISGPIGTTVPPAAIVIYDIDRGVSMNDGILRVAADLTDHHNTTILLPPGDEFRVRAATRLTYVDGDLDITLDWTYLGCSIDGTGIAI